MSNIKITVDATVNEDGMIVNVDLPPAVLSSPPDPTPVNEVMVRPAAAPSLNMVLINDSDLPSATLQHWRDVYQQVIDDHFAYDWTHVALRIGSGVDDFDPSSETPHFLTNGLDVDGAAGYHSVVVRAGGDIDGVAFTDVDSADPDETLGHEIFEWAANPTTSSFHQYWGDPDRLIMGEVCDPVTRAPHVVRSVSVSAWVTQRYLQGDNQEDPASYDSSRWFSEQPRVSGPKKRTNGGFQIFWNMRTSQVEYEFGPVDLSVPWQMRERFPTADQSNLTTPAQGIADHVDRRVLRFLRNHGGLS